MELRETRAVILYYTHTIIEYIPLLLIKKSLLGLLGKNIHCKYFCVLVLCYLCVIALDIVEFDLENHLCLSKIFALIIFVFVNRQKSECN